MPRYMDTAAEANRVAHDLLGLFDEINSVDKDYVLNIKAAASELIARLYNLGIRTAPRAVQSTVRYNAVKRAVQDLPVKVSMEQRTDERTHRTYNVLITQPIGGVPSVEMTSGGEFLDNE